MQDSIGNRLRRVRESLGITQEDVANTLGLTRNIIVNIENDYRSVKSEELYLFSRFYKISMEELITGKKGLNLKNEFFYKAFDELSDEDKEEVIKMVENKLNY